jgi:hypothetical protein
MDDSELVKIYIDLPNHWAIGGESVWASQVGKDLYKIENVPFYAYGLNFHDIVRAIPMSDDEIPTATELIALSGHRTFRVFFQNHINKEAQEETLDSMKHLTVSYERCNSIYFSLDLKPEADYPKVYDQLAELELQDILAFETCEAREDGSFDDSPESNSDNEAEPNNA